MHAAGRGSGEREDALRAMSDADPDVVAEAATRLGMRGDERSVDALVELLHRQEPTARAAGAAALGLIGSERAVADLREASHDPDPSVVGASLLALARLGDAGSADAACDSLVTQLRSADPELRALAARALGGLLEERAVDPLMAALADEEPQVRADAAASLGRVADSRVTTALASLSVSDPVPYVREVALHSMARLVRRTRAH